MPKRLITTAIVIAGLAAGTLTVSAASSSVAGDPLYGLHKALDAFRIATSLSDTSKAATHLSIATSKLDELQVLVVKNKPTELIAEVTDELSDNEAKAGINVSQAQAKGKNVTELVTRLQDNLTRQQQVLTTVLNRVPDQAKPAIEKAITASQNGLNTAIEQQQKTTGGSSSSNGNSSSTPGASNAQNGLQNKPATPNGY